MLSIEIIRAMVTYHYALFRRVWDTSIMTLTDEQFTTEIPYSHGSIRNHMVHLAAVDRGWMLGMQEDPNARANRPHPTCRLSHPRQRSCRLGKVRAAVHGLYRHIKRGRAALSSAEFAANTLANDSACG